jgi:hypothetical protein
MGRGTKKMKRTLLQRSCSSWNADTGLTQSPQEKVESIIYITLACLAMLK